MKKKDIYIQENQSSCGSCAIASIVSFYGGYIPLETIIEDTCTDKNGTNAYMIVKALEKYGFMAYGIKTNIEALKEINRPFIAHVIKNGYEHFLVVYDVSDRYIKTMDPEVGEQTYSLSEFNNMFDGYVIKIYKTGEIPKYEKSKSLMVFMKNLFKDNVKSYLSILILNLIVITMSIIPSFQLKLLSMNMDPTMISKILVFMFIMMLILSIIKDRCTNKLIKNISKANTSIFTKHIFKLSLKYINAHRTGEIVRKIEDISFLKDIFLRILLVNTIDIFAITISSFIMVHISLYITLLYLVILLLYGLITVLTLNKTYRMTKENIKLQEDYSATLYESLNGLESIKNLNGEERFLTKNSTTLEKYLTHTERFENYISRVKSYKNFIFQIGIVFINLIGFLSIDSNFTFYDLMTIESIFSLLFSSFDSLLVTYSEYIKAKAIFKNLGEFIDIKEERNENTYDHPFKELKIENLSYSYDKLNDNIKGFNLTIKKGDKVLLKGPSGIGKSTLVKCLCGILDNYKGNIFLNGIDIQKISVTSLRNKITYIGQDEQIFMGTIKDNITLGIESSDSIDRILKLVELEDTINKRPSGLETKVLEGASNLSGGEISRLLLARALYRNPKILIIDETLSSIGIEMENRIIENLLKIDDLTLIYITHRNKDALFKNMIIFRKDSSYEIK